MRDGGGRGATRPAGATDAQAAGHLAGRDLVRVGVRDRLAVDDQVPPLRAAGDPGAGHRHRLLPRRSHRARAWRTGAAALAVGLPLLLLVTVDLAGAKNAAQHFLWLFSYDYVHSPHGPPLAGDARLLARAHRVRDPVRVGSALLRLAARAAGRSRGCSGAGRSPSRSSCSTTTCRRWRRSGRRRIRSPPTTNARRSPEERLFAYRCTGAARPSTPRTRSTRARWRSAPCSTRRAPTTSSRTWSAHHRGQRAFFLFERDQQAGSAERPAARGAGVVPDHRRAATTSSRWPRRICEMRRAGRCRRASTARRATVRRAGRRRAGEGEGRALLEAIFASGDFLPELLLADVRALAALAADPWLRRPSRPRSSRGGAGGDGGRARLRRLQRRLRARAPPRDAAPRRARARLGHDRGGRARAVGVRRRLPRRGGRLLRRRAARELGPPRADSGAPTRASS